MLNTFHGMSRERYLELQQNESLSLTQDELNQGWHFCIDWDGLLIHKDDPEIDGCSCGWEKECLP